MDDKNEKPASHFAYMLICGDGTIYSGYSTDPVRRCAVHNRGQGAKYTRSRLPVKLAFAAEFESKGEALRGEIMLKRLTRDVKLELIEAQRERHENTD